MNLSEALRADRRGGTHRGRQFLQWMADPGSFCEAAEISDDPCFAMWLKAMEASAKPKVPVRWVAVP